MVAANAGGAFSPFGDITTLMVWQKGMRRTSLRFSSCSFHPLVNFLIPALLMHFAVPDIKPTATSDDVAHE